MTVSLDAPIPRIALTPPEAAAALGCGETYFSEHVRPELRLIRRGRKVLIPVSELQRWAAENADRPIAEEVAP
ncbi:MAG: helix-turn-helix domain-containing protein [Solirubrobacterales bacterium]